MLWIATGFWFLLETPNLQLLRNGNTLAQQEGSVGKGATPEHCPCPSEVGHPPPTHTSKCSLERNSLVVENKDFQ